jgi:hypothetical protein
MCRARVWVRAVLQNIGSADGGERVPRREQPLDMRCECVRR